MQLIEPARVVAVLALSLAAPAVVHAGGDAAAGKRTGAACAACHAASDPPWEAPRLAGQNEGYLARQLRAFRGGERAHPLMDEITRRMTDGDIADVAAFWSHQPAGSDAVLPPQAQAIRASHMQFPAGFPTGFTLYLTLNDVEHRVVKQHYINAAGLEATRTGKPLPDGTVVLQVNYTARLAPDGQPVTDHQGAWAVDRVESYTGMEARAGWGQDLPDWLRNARWNFGKFSPARAPLVTANQAICLACHKRQALVGYLYTFNELRDAAHAR